MIRENNEEIKLTKEMAAKIDRTEIASSELTEEQEIYKENIIDHYKAPHNNQKMHKCTLSRREFNPLCGDDLTLFLKLGENKIMDASFTGKGCAISQASISMLTDYLKDLPLEDAKSLKREDILGMLGIPIGVVRMKCALLSLKALLKGIQEFELDKVEQQ